MSFAAVRDVDWYCVLYLCPGLLVAFACGGFPEVKEGVHRPHFSYRIVSGLVDLVR